MIFIEFSSTIVNHFRRERISQSHANLSIFLKPSNRPFGWHYMMSCANCEKLRFDLGI